jgi:hypothetical protein
MKIETGTRRYRQKGRRKAKEGRRQTSAKQGIKEKERKKTKRTLAVVFA